MRRQIFKVIGAILTVVFIGYSITKLDIAVFLDTIRRLNYLWVLLSMAVVGITMAIRTTRWHLIMALPREKWLNVWEATSIGYMGTAVFPARAGEVMRVVHLQRLPDVSTGLVVASSVVDRVFEGLGLCALLALAVIIAVPDPLIKRALITTSIIFVVLAFSVALFVYAGGRLQFGRRAVPRFGSIGDVVAKWYKSAHDDLQSLRDAQRIGILVLLQIITSILDVVACWLLMLAMGWDLSIVPALMVLVFLAIGTSLPSTPGYVGVYQVTAMMALQSFQVEPSAAIAYGTVLQVSNFILFVGAGILAYRTSGARDKKIRQTSEASQAVTSTTTRV